MKGKLIIFALIFIGLLQFSCKEDETLASFAENNKKIEDRNENLNIKNDTFLETIIIQAEQNDELIPRKIQSKRVHEIGVDFYKYIDDLKSVFKKKKSMEYINELFFNGASITNEGKEFLMNINNYKQSMNEIIGKTNPRISGMVNNNFDTSVIEDRRGQTTNWLNLNFKDFAPIISITKLSTMQSDIRRIETQYLAELLGVKLNLKTKKVIQNLKTNTDTQISQNVKGDSLNALGKQMTTENNVKEIPKKTVANANAEDKELDVKTIEEKDKDKVVKITPKVVKKEITAKKEDSNNFYVVQKGENVYRIALKNKISIAKLKQLNGMTNNNISVGQKLKVK